MNMINICKAIGDGCHYCPFSDRCDEHISFRNYNTKEYWLEELNDMLKTIQYAIEKVKNYED